MSVVKKCIWCGQYFGTSLGAEQHRSGDEAYPKCRSERRMKELGMWQGLRDIWWTRDLGIVEDRGFYYDASETPAVAGAQVPQKGFLRLVYCPPRFGEPRANP